MSCQHKPTYRPTLLDRNPNATDAEIAHEIALLDAFSKRQMSAYDCAMMHVYVGRTLYKEIRAAYRGSPIEESSRMIKKLLLKQTLDDNCYAGDCWHRARNAQSAWKDLKWAVEERDERAAAMAAAAAAAPAAEMDTEMAGAEEGDQAANPEEGASDGGE